MGVDTEVKSRNLALRANNPGQRSMLSLRERVLLMSFRTSVVFPNCSCFIMKHKAPVQSFEYGKRSFLQHGLLS